MRTVFVAFVSLGGFYLGNMCRRVELERVRFRRHQQATDLCTDFPIDICLIIVASPRERQVKHERHGHGEEFCFIIFGKHR